MLLDNTRDIMHNSLLSPTASSAAANGAGLDRHADEEFGNEVSAVIVGWISKRMSNYHVNFHDTQLMQVGFVYCTYAMRYSSSSTKNALLRVVSSSL